jgi:hypothetical protein
MLSFAMSSNNKSTTSLHFRRKAGDNADISTLKVNTSSSSSFPSLRRQSSYRSAWVSTAFIALLLICFTFITMTLVSPTNRALSSPHDLQSTVLRSDTISGEIRLGAPDDSSVATSNTTSTKPLFLLHIGPPKTGTTALQCYLGLNYQKLAKQDNFYYLGTWYAPLCGLPSNYSIDGFVDVPRPSLLDCYAPHVHRHCDMDQRWSDFAGILQSHYEQGHNIIMSDEMFHHHFQLDDVLRLQNILEKWNVRIMYTYRHFYSSVPSMYHQLNDPYATEVGMANAVEKTIWPSDGGYRIESFRNANNFVIEDDMHRFSYWANAFGIVEVFNMETVTGGSHNYLPSFLCTMIPEAKSSLCNMQMSAVASSSEHRNDNGSSSKHLHYDMLAVAAKEEGLLARTNLNRVGVRDAIQEYCERNDWTSIHAFPLDCLTPEELQPFLEQSLHQAEMMEAYFVNGSPIDRSSIESEIRSGFWEYAEQKQFCSVNANLILQQEMWQQFFHDLANTTR